MKTSLIITTANEIPDLIDCLNSFKKKENLIILHEIIVVAPDKDSEHAVLAFETLFNNKLKYLKDKGKGKISALNLAIKKAEGDIVIFTDGDCVVDNLLEIIIPFNDKTVGVATGQVLPKKMRRRTKWEFFHKFLLGAADHIRRKKSFVEASAYLMAIRKNILEEFPQDVAEDSWISAQAHAYGYKSVYCPEATVKVRGPENTKDWIKQKTRTALAHEKQQGQKIKSFKNEIIEGIKYTVFVHDYNNLREMVWWLPQLYCLRLYTWIKVKLMSLKGESYKDGWEPVVSTKK